MSGLFTAFSMYSTVPVPKVKWEKSTLRWSLAFLPLVGVLIGGVEKLWYCFCVRVGATGLMYAVFAVMLPLAISGGIHLDGFCDTCDAVCSFADKEKRLEIMKDPHIGAFGAMWLMAFLLMETACFFQLYETPGRLILALTGFAVSRVFGALKIVLTKCAKDTGLAKIFSDNSDKGAVTAMLAIEAFVLIAFVFTSFRGEPYGMYFAAVWAAVLVAWYIFHDRMCLKMFGGVTGDLAGYYISLSELITLVAAALGGVVL